jgi:hypothetical protein
MADFALPVPLEEEEQEEGGAAAPLMALLRQQQAQRAQANAALQQAVGKQRAQAQGMRSLGFLSSFGANPILQGLRQEAGQQAGAFEGMAARGEAQAQRTASDVNPLDILRLEQAQQRLNIMGQRETGLDRRFDAAQKQRGEQFAATLGFKWADLNQDQRLAMLRLADAKEGRESSAALRKEEAVDKATERLGKEIVDTGAPGFYMRYDEAVDLLKKNPKDVPGMGRIEGQLPAEMLSDDGRKMRYLVGQLLSEYRKGQTGAGMSDAERAEYGVITGLVNSGTDKGVKEGLDLLRRALDARVQATGAGFRPEAVETLSKRTPRVGQALKGQQRTPAATAIPTGADGALSLEDVPTPPAKALPPLKPGNVRVRVGGKLGQMPKGNVDAFRAAKAKENVTVEVMDG